MDKKELSNESIEKEELEVQSSPGLSFKKINIVVEKIYTMKQTNFEKFEDFITLQLDEEDIRHVQGLSGTV